MGSLLVEGRAHARYGHLTQARLLKPTTVFALLEPLLPAAWDQLAGGPRADYFEHSRVTLVFTHLRIDRAARPLRVDDELGLRFESTAGWYAGRDGARRYGLLDRFAAVDGDGEPVLGWTAHVMWVGAQDGAPRPEPAPGLRLSQEVELPSPPRRPDAPAVPGAEVGRFRWTPRETDLNRHVHFQSYLERTENAVTDAGGDTEASRTWSLWFARPAFLGETGIARVAEDGDATQVQLCRDDGTVWCTVRGEA